MNSSIKSILAFSAGAAIGAFVSWQYLKRKYDELLNEQIEEVKEEMVAEFEREAETERKEYDTLRSDYLQDTDEDEEPEKETFRKPYVITPEELGEIDEFDTTTLYYYDQDDVLVNLQNEVVEDVEDTVGLDFAEHYGEFEDDSVCIRNEKHKCDYEVLKVSKKYSDVKKPAPSDDTEE